MNSIEMKFKRRQILIVVIVGIVLGLAALYYFSRSLFEGALVQCLKKDSNGNFIDTGNCKFKNKIGSTASYSPGIFCGVENGKTANVKIFNTGYLSSTPCGLNDSYPKSFASPT